MKEVKECPGCGRENWVGLMTANGKPMARINVEGFEVLMSLAVNYVRCLYCGMVWQNPQMEDDQLARWYSEGFYRKWLDQSQDALDKDERYRTYKTMEWITEDYQPAPTSLLDIGCSRGYLLDLFAEGGVTVAGVESNLNYVETKQPVFQNLEDVHRTYDAISLIHVLEHIGEPVRYLQYVRNLMHDKTRLYIEIPSANSKGSPYRLAHLTYMEPSVLANVCRSAGLKVISISISEDWHTRVVCMRNDE